MLWGKCIDELIVWVNTIVLDTEVENGQYK